MDDWIIGIGGTAMASLAICLRRQGRVVGGSDEGVYPPMSDLLREAGIAWREGYSAKNLPDAPCRIIVANAIPRGNPELEAALEAGRPLTCLPELIRSDFLPGRHSVVVSGTHGKTTTTNLLALLLREAGLDPGWLIGGRPAGLPSPMHAGSGPFLIEGDEYDTVFYDKRSKFLHYWPRTLVINHIEFDHSDIFENVSQIQHSFRLLLRLLPAGGRLIVNGDSPLAMEVAADSPAPLTTFGEGEGCDCRLLGERPEGESSVYTYLLDGVEHALRSPMQGAHNGRNLAVALLLARQFGVPQSILEQVAAGFSGPGRRMDRYELKGGGLLYDDFAHHPTAIRESLRGLRLRHPERRITALFEPRSNTSVTNVMQQEFMEALSGADRAGMGALHRAWKYAPETLFDFALAAGWFAGRGIPFAQRDKAEELADWALEDFGKDDLLVLFSNGSFQGLRELVLERLAK